MPEESVYSPENPQNVIDSFVRPIWYHELLTDETKELLAQSRQDLKNILHKGHIDIDNMIAVPSGGARWRLSKQDPTNYQFLFDGDIPPRDELRHEFNGLWILPREWDSVGHAMKHQDRSNALKALMITPDQLVVGNMELARRLRLEALKKGGEVWWNDGVAEYVKKKVNKWGTPKDEADISKIRFERALRDRMSRESNPEVWRENFLIDLESRNDSIPAFSEYSLALEQLGGAIDCPENRNPDSATV